MRRPAVTVALDRCDEVVLYIPVLGETSMTAEDLPALIEAVAAVLTIALVMWWMGPE